MPPGCWARRRGKPYNCPASSMRLLPQWSFYLVLEVGQQAHLLPQRDAVPLVHPLGQLAHLVWRQPQGLAQVPHRAAGAVGIDHSGKGRPLPAVFLVHPQDQLLADVAGKVQVDVRHAGQFVVGQEPLQGETVAQGVDVRDSQQIALSASTPTIPGRAPAG